MYTFEFRVSPGLFRRVQYFNTFGRRRGQGALVAAAFIGAFALMIVNVFGRVAMSNVMQMCYIVCLVALPLCVLSCELNTRKYVDSEMDKITRVVSVGSDWVKLRSVGGAFSEKLEWEQVSVAFETKSAFVIYRDSDRYAAIPKSAFAPGDVDSFRLLLQEKLGRGFHRRA